MKRLTSDSASFPPPSTQRNASTPFLPSLLPRLASHPTSSSEPARAILVAADFDKHDFQENLSKLVLSASTAGSEPVHAITGECSRPDATLLIGAGKMEEMKITADEEDAEIVIFNHALSPAWQRNLERFFGHYMVDRTGLILDIFNQYVQSHVGKVQVRLARMRHQTARLVRAWGRLEHQKGGVGLRNSPGERQLELDRRMLNERVERLPSELDELQRQHDTQRHSRSRNDAFPVSLIGYTNAGKSTSFNALAKVRAYTANQLFTTLDTTSRRLYLKGLGNMVLSDTVGFIHDLPTQLVATFQTTLERTMHADVLFHAVDAASTVRHEQMEQVDHVLDEVDASGVPQILVTNKVDAAEELRVAGPRIKHDETGAVWRVFVSVVEGTGLDLLYEALVETAIRLREHPASHGGDFDPRFSTRHNSPPARHDELSQSSPNSGSSARGGEEG